MYFVPIFELPYVGSPSCYSPCYTNTPFLQSILYQPPLLPQPPINLFHSPCQFSEGNWSSKAHQFQNTCRNSTKVEYSHQIHSKEDSGFEELKSSKREGKDQESQSGSFDGKQGLNKKRGQRIHRKYNQNAQRNVLTNIGNQLITFLGNRKRSENAYLSVNNQATNEEIAEFYEFIHKLRRRKRIPVYINKQKLLEIWYPKNSKFSHPKNYRILRQMSLIFLQEILPLFLINSTRIKKETKILHIAAARKMLHMLRYHHEDK